MALNNVIIGRHTLILLLSLVVLEPGVALGAVGVGPDLFVALVPLFFFVDKAESRLLAVTPLLRIVEGAVLGGLLFVCVASFVVGFGS